MKKLRIKNKKKGVISVFAMVVIGILVFFMVVVLVNFGPKIWSGTGLMKFLITSIGGDEKCQGYTAEEYKEMIDNIKDDLEERENLYHRFMQCFPEEQEKYDYETNDKLRFNSALRIKYEDPDKAKILIKEAYDNIKTKSRYGKDDAEIIHLLIELIEDDDAKETRKILDDYFEKHPNDGHYNDYFKLKLAEDEYNSGSLEKALEIYDNFFQKYKTTNDFEKIPNPSDTNAEETFSEALTNLENLCLDELEGLVAFDETNAYFKALIMVYVRKIRFSFERQYPDRMISYYKEGMNLMNEKLVSDKEKDTKFKFKEELVKEYGRYITNSEIPPGSYCRAYVEYINKPDDIIRLKETWTQENVEKLQTTFIRGYVCGNVAGYDPDEKDPDYDNILAEL